MKSLQPKKLRLEVPWKCLTNSPQIQSLKKSFPKPNKGPQEAFLKTQADICIYGGSAGGGKSFGLLLDAAQHLDNGKYGAVIFRRTSPQILNEGGLWDDSMKIFAGIGTPLRQAKMWKFPTGAKIQFRHLQHEETKLNWQGAQVPYLGFDELTHFTESQFFYLLSRNRSACGVRPRVRGTCNPSPGWVKTFLAPWLDKDYSGPGGQAQSAELRYFVRREGEIVWDVSRAAITLRFPDVKSIDIKSVTFIRSSLWDNKPLLKVNPEYEGNLRALPTVEMKRLLFGDWDVFAGSFYSEFSTSVHTMPPLGQANEYKLPKHWRFIGGLDWGYRDPFAFVLGAVDELGRLHIVESVSQAGLTNEQQAEQVRAVLARWGVSPSECFISADETMWNRKTINGVQAPPDIEAFQKAGLYVAPSKSSRRAGQSEIRRVLHADGRDKSGKSLSFVLWQGYNSELIRQFPAIQWSKKGEDSEDNDARGAASPDGGHWDVLNALRYLFDSRLPTAGESEEDRLARLRAEKNYPAHARPKSEDTDGELMW